jgi:hypothetical protein
MLSWIFIVLGYWNNSLFLHSDTDRINWDTSENVVSEWYFLMPNEQFFSCIMARTFFDESNYVCFVLDQHTLLDFPSASSLKEQAVGWYVVSLWHINLILSQPVMSLTSKCCVLSGEALHTNFIFFWFYPNSVVVIMYTETFIKDAIGFICIWHHNWSFSGFICIWHHDWSFSVLKLICWFSQNTSVRSKEK